MKKNFFEKKFFFMKNISFDEEKSEGSNVVIEI